MDKFLPLSLVLFVLVSVSTQAFTSSIHAPAVLSNQDKGIITVISLNITQGNGTISVGGPDSVGSSTIQSAQDAVQYASYYTGITESDYNFDFYIGNTTNVSGPSAGLAMTLLTISAIDQKQLLQNFTLTGTILPNGDVGMIGGVYDKISAARTDNLKYVLVPSAPEGSFEYLLYYISQQAFGIKVIEVSNVTDAIPYAFGNSSSIHKPLSLNVSNFLNTFTNLNVTDAKKMCSLCNSESFRNLTAFTFNMTANEINNISGNYSAVKTDMLSLLNQYKEIGSKGYSYTAADLSFLEYIDAFVLSNSANLTLSKSYTISSHTYSYCSSLTPPVLTGSNYEFVLGGELRQSWALYTINQSENVIKSAQTTDDLVRVLSTLAEANAWCNAANIMYGEASNISGEPVSYSDSIIKNATELVSEIKASSELSQSMYGITALQDYAQGEYGAAIYSAVYAKATFTSQGNLSEGYLRNATLLQIKNISSGIWSSEFANEALFYLQEANMTSDATQKDAYIAEAYSSAVLASSFNNANKLLSSSFLPGSSISSSEEFITIEKQISQLYIMVFFIAILLAIILILILVILLHRK